MDLLNQTLTLQEIRGLTGLTSRRIQQLKQEGNISDLGSGKYAMINICEYITYQAKLVEKRKIKAEPKPDDLDPDQMRARKDLAHAEKLELDLAQTRKELLVAEEVRQAWGRIGTALRAGFQGAPDRVADQIEAMVVEAMEEDQDLDAREIREAVRKVIDEILSEVKGGV